MIQHLTEIVEEARKRGKKRLAVAYGQDSHTLEAVYEAYKEGLVEPTLYGEKSVIEQVCAENDIDIKAFNIVDETSDWSRPTNTCAAFSTRKQDCFPRKAC